VQDGTITANSAKSVLAEMFASGRSITANSAKGVLAEMFASGRSATAIVQEGGLAQVSDEEALTRVVDEVLAANPEQVAKYRAGKRRGGWPRSRTRRL